MNSLVTFLLICLASLWLSGESAYDVSQFGAVGDGWTDDTLAFLKAWKDVCIDTGYGGTPTLVVPPGKTFLLKPLMFTGPCMAKNINIEISGTIVAPNTIESYGGCIGINKWLSFSKINGLHIYGEGWIDGQGSPWWALTESSKNGEKGETDCDKPTALHFNKCDNLQIYGVHSINPPQNHISINACNNVDVSNIDIKAPSNSPNTDGIDISASTQVNIHDLIIGTGDDCIAINGGSSNINITNIACGPGHGISIGSLGKNGKYETVEDVRVKGSTFTRTTNGARIKTWPEGLGFVKRITYEDITLVDVENPIIIDQHYCNGRPCVSNLPSLVKISDVTFSWFRGSVAAKTKDAISLICSDATWCWNVVMDHVNITPVVPGLDSTAACKNVDGRSISSSPQLSCLKQEDIAN